MLLQGNNCEFSWFVSVHGEAQLAGNGRSPWQELQRRPWALTSQPEGRCCGLPLRRYSACKGLAIHYALCLAAEAHSSAEPAIITLKEH